MYLNREVNLQLIKIEMKRKKCFVIKKSRLAKSINLVYFCKKPNNRFRKIFSDFFFAMRRMEIISGTIPFFKKLFVRAKGKKKTKKKMFVIIKCNFFINLENFLNFYLISEAYNNISDLIKVKKKYKYLQEFYKKRFISKHFLLKNSIIFIDNFFIKNIITYKVKKSKNYLKKIFFKKDKSFILKVCVNSQYSKYFSKLFYLKLLNKHKILLFLYKYFRNKIIKI